MKQVVLLGKLAAYAIAILWFMLAANQAVWLLNQKNDIAVLAGIAIVIVLVWVAWIVVAKYVPLLKRLIKGMSLLIVLALLSGCYRVVSPGHVGIVVKQTGGERGVQEIPVETGRVFYNPFNEDVLDYPTFVQRAIWTSSTSEGKATNEEIAFQSMDSLHFTGDVAVSYQLIREKVPHFYVQFRSDDLEAFTHGFFRDAVRKAIGVSATHFTAEEINGGKQADLENQAQAAVTANMAAYGVQVVQLAFTSPPRPPDVVKQAIQGKIAAIQRAEQIENEKRQAIAEGEKTVALASATARANGLINASITPQLVQWRQLDVLTAKWDGRFAMVQGGNNPLLLNITPDATQHR